jgi:hypothetical protein
MRTDAARPSGANGEALSSDLLVGAQEISMFLYGPEEGLKTTNLRRTYHAIAKGDIPIFKLGGKIHARRSAIRARIEAQEQAA